MTDTNALGRHPLLIEIDKAQRELEAWTARRDNYDGNNPDKFVIDVQRAREHLAALEYEAKVAGVIPKSPLDLISDELDKLYPQAQSRELHEHGGTWYIKKFRPLAKSRTGKTVHAYEGYWSGVPNDDPAVLDLVSIPQGGVERARWDAVRWKWPFGQPLGGSRLNLAVGEPAAQTLTTMAPVGFDRGPIMRVKLLVQLTMTAAALDALVVEHKASNGRPAVAKGKAALFLGQLPDGRRAELRKTGGGYSGLYVDIQGDEPAPQDDSATGAIYRLAP